MPAMLCCGKGWSVRRQQIKIDNIWQNTPEEIKPGCFIGKACGAITNAKAWGGMNRKAVPFYEKVVRMNREFSMINSTSRHREVGDLDILQNLALIWHTAANWNVFCRRWLIQ